MSVGDALELGDGSQRESHKIASLGTAATDFLTLWQSLPDEPVI